MKKNNYMDIPEVTRPKPIKTEGKTRNWLKYYNNNTLHHADCQLVTACNAYYHLTGDIIDNKSKFYKKMLKDCGCLHGACINIKKAWKKLGIKRDKTFKNIFDIDLLLHPDNFFEIVIWYKRYGFHSIAAIDYSKKCDALRITNFKYQTSLDGWIFLEDLKPYIYSNNGTRYLFRTFKLRK